MAYLVRCARQRRCREAPAVAAGVQHSLFVYAAGRLLACDKGEAVGHGGVKLGYPVPAPAAGMAEIRVRSVAAGSYNSLGFGSDGRIYSWGDSNFGQLGHGETLIYGLR